MNQPYRILVTTSDKYLEALKPFAWLLNKYWQPNPQVVIGGFTPPDFPLPPNFTFYSIGRFVDYPVQRWSDALIRFLMAVPDEVFVLMLEDMWPIRQVYTDIVGMAYDYMRQFEYVARLDLTGDRLHAGDASFYGKLDYVDLIWSNPFGQYHLSTMPAFWRKRHLLRALVPGETPWQVELNGTPRLGALHDETIVLGTNAWPVKNTLAFRGGTTGQLILDEVEPDDIRDMRAQGILDGLE